MNTRTVSSSTAKFVRTLAISGLFGIGGISASHGEIIPVAWAERAFAHTSSIAPKKFLEICGALEKGEAVAWQFKGSAATDFNIHYHVGKKVSYPQKRKGVASASGKLAVPIDQDYCWMWTNNADQPVNLSVKLKK